MWEIEPLIPKLDIVYESVIDSLNTVVDRSLIAPASPFEYTLGPEDELPSIVTDTDAVADPPRPSEIV